MSVSGLFFQTYGQPYQLPPLNFNTSFVRQIIICFDLNMVFTLKEADFICQVSVSLERVAIDKCLCMHRIHIKHYPSGRNRLNIFVPGFTWLQVPRIKMVRIGIIWGVEVVPFSRVKAAIRIYTSRVRSPTVKARWNIFKMFASRVVCLLLTAMGFTCFHQCSCE